MFPHELIKTIGEDRATFLDNVRMCPRCLEEGRVEWVRIHDPWAHARPCGDRDRQYCESCNSTWDFVECVSLSAWMEGIMLSMAVLDYDGTDLARPGIVENIQQAQERRQQAKETAEPQYKSDTRHGW